MRLISLLGLLLPAIALADPRSELLDATLAGAPPEQHAAIRFLIGHMPDRDVESLKPDYLRENVALAHKARAEFPWAAEIPTEIFHNDVVPYATLDESRDDWRADFLDRFRTHAAGATSVRDAVLRVNAVVMKETGVDYSTQRRAANQGPRESMELKIASCTGLSILLVNALRSVGLPARIAGTAMWTTKRGNHNWVEVWLPETEAWHFTEFHLNRKGLDHGWLLADAARGIPGSRLHGVFATSWERTDKHFPLVWNMADTNVPGIDVTQRYIDLGAGSLPAVGECELRIEAVNAAGVRQPLEVTVRQADVLVGSGTTPGTSDDTNRFFTVTVKQGQLYQVVLGGQDARPLAVEHLEIKKDEETRRVTLKIEPR